MKRIIYFILLICCANSVFAQQLARLEYWFNDGYASRQTVSLGGNEQQVNLSLETGNLASGLHKVYMRLQNSDGSYSPVTENYFFKTSVTLAYWFNQEIGNRKALAPAVQNTREPDFSQTVGTSEIDNGLHKLMLQVAGGAVYSTYFSKGLQLPVASDAQASDAQLTQYVCWLGGYENVKKNIEFSPSKSEVHLQDTIDFTGIPAGKYKLNIAFQNSYNNQSTLQTDVVNIVRGSAPDGASINLEASKTENNLIQLKWNSLSDIDYYILSRNNVSIAVEKTTAHPTEILKIDNPKEGSYSYRVEAYSINENKAYPSNIATVEVNDANENVHLDGSLMGTVRDEMSVPVENVKLTFSHNNQVYISPDGKYLIQGIPYGTQGKLTAEKEGYKFKPKYGYLFTDGMNYHITEKTPDLTFDLTAEIDYNYGGGTAVIAQKPELELASAIDEDFHHFMIDNGAIKVNQPLSFDIRVKNISETQWSGWLYLTMNTTAGNEYAYSTLDTEIAKVEMASLASGAEAGLNFVIPDGIRKPTGTYRFTILSQQKQGSTLLSKKQLASGSYSNPALVEIENQDVYKTAEEYMQMVNSKFGTKSFIDALTIVSGAEKDPAKKNKLMRTVMGDISRSIQEQLDMKYFLAVEQDVQTLIKLIGELDALRTQEYDPVIFFSICSKILDETGGPLGNILKVYFDVGEKAAAAIKNMESFLYDNALIEYDTGEGEIDIIVKHDKGWPLGFLKDRFSSNDIASQVDRVELYYNKGRAASGHRELYKSGEQKREALTYGIGQTSGGYMTSGQVKISWSNGRISWVPLTSKCTDPHRSSGRIDISFHSQNGDVEYMADKLILTLP
ncbi:MAG: hypothetical protein LBL79_12035 [Prevotella sp.]|nr:hypothetical protein [Prevotella sp.]